ncbi:hypothetical protein Natpe_2719 [Natrinema pellirubrum DSM 15624]|uniref:Uncharacterized protein n=1 Tax=Natrinema pellirubrum (strain DSM 15624 / CIP 106293 / JCM 10476 / NCIMB 786 / 157) TaxID=797303 RepID=L0JMN1_NATP1|nr:hypothetical protein [Natrinema pellirubrum]AGB32524.1 hypothetical protein Natpe_2719 [Natrinema pellirubrum DSM 15624]
MNEFINNLRDSRQIAAAALAVIYGIYVLFTLSGDPSSTQLTVTLLVASAISYIIPHLSTSIIVGRLASESQSKTYLDILERESESLDEVYLEIPDEYIVEELPDKISDFDSAKMVDKQLFDQVDGSQFDKIDSRLRGAVALLVVIILTSITSPIFSHIFYANREVFLVNVLCSIIILGVGLIVYQDILEIVEYTPVDIKDENQ